MRAITLRPCPFCGSSNGEDGSPDVLTMKDNSSCDESTNMFWVTCNYCRAEGGISNSRYGAELIWNTRS